MRPVFSKRLPRQLGLPDSGDFLPLVAARNCLSLCEENEVVLAAANSRTGTFLGEVR